MAERDNRLYNAIKAQVADHAHIDVPDKAVATLLATLTSGLVQAIPDALCASITVAENSTVFSVAASDPVAERMDHLQALHGTGPCLMSSWEQQRIVITDYVAERRWRLFADDVVALSPVRSTMSFELYREPDSMGALSLHFDRLCVADESTIALGHTFATQITSAWELQARAHQFHTALASRDVIGQAKGIVMHQYNLDADAAFTLIRRLSQETNTKVADLAHRLATTTTTQREQTTTRNPPSGPP